MCTAAAIATLLGDGECWQSYSKQTPWKAQHFSTHAEAFEAVSNFDDRAEKKACDDRACAATRSAAVATYQERAQRAQQHAVATSRAWRLAGSSSTEITKANAKAGFVVTIEAALLAWISGSGAAASDSAFAMVGNSGPARRRTRGNLGRPGLVPCAATVPCSCQIPADTASVSSARDRQGVVATGFPEKFVTQFGGPWSASVMCPIPLTTHAASGVVAVSVAGSMPSWLTRPGASSC